MWRKAYLVCLLLPLTAGAVTPPDGSGAVTSPNDARHYWPLAAVSRTDDRAARRLDFIPTGTAMDLAVQEMRQAAAQATPRRNDSLVHADLNRRVRLALIGFPTPATNHFGVTSVNVALFGLKW